MKVTERIEPGLAGVVKFLFIFLIFISEVALASYPFPSKELRLKLFDGFIAEIERLDGEGLIPRKNRPENWKKTISRLRTEATQAETTFEFGRVLKRIDATYPNLHAHITLDPEYDYVEKFGKVRPAVNFIPEKSGHDVRDLKFVISSVNKELASRIPEADRPKLGDQILAINGKPMRWWRSQNFLFCKLPLKGQCDNELWDNFRKELLSWSRNIPLVYKVKSGKKIWDVKIPLVDRSSSQNKSEVNSPKTPCGVDEKRYPDFKIVYEGFNACIFESDKFPAVSIWRISSFRYRNLPKDAKIDSLQKEVDLVWENYWKSNAAKTKKLIIDVIENGGGDTPIPWYKIFLTAPFQEQYTQFKKIPELENTEIRKAVFYDDPAKEIWFQNIKKDGTYEKIHIGSFLPTIPQFCADDEKDCREGLFTPKDHGFKGQVSLLVDPYCVSSCVGFVWNLRHHLKNRVKIFGSPDSGDSAYARVYLDAILDPKLKSGFELKVVPRPGRTSQDLPPGVLFRQQVSVTRSTDSQGRIISGIPQAVDKPVSRKFDQDDTEWAAAVLKEALVN